MKKTKKVKINIDLAATYGGAKLIMPTNVLPRHDKAQRELTVAHWLLDIVQPRSSGSFTNVRSNPNDPPDVLFEHNDVTTGIELTELLPPNRLEKNDIIRSLKKKILSGLDIGPNTRNRVVNIFFTDDYSQEFRPNKNCVDPLVRLLNDFFESPRASSMGRCILDVPSQLQGVVSHITVDVTDLAGHPRIDNESHPLIILGPQHTMIVVEDDIPAMIDATFGPKLLHDLSIPTWLLVWSDNPALSMVQKEIISHLRPYLSSKQIKYQHVFYLHMGLPGVMEHIPIIKDDRPLLDKDDT